MKGFYVTADDITTKTQFVAALWKFIRTGETTVPYEHGEYCTSPGEMTLIEAIVNYFEAHDEIPDKESGINFFVDLAQHLVDAFHEFRTHKKHEMLRQIYKGQTAEGDEIPDLFDARGRYTRQRVIRDLGRLMPLIAGRMGGTWLEPALIGYFDAQIHVVEAAWREFVRACYRTIAPRIKKSRSRSHKSLFGRTWLSVDTMAGRAQYTFGRVTSEPDVRILDKLTAIAENRDATSENKYAAIEALLMTRRPQPPTLGQYEISFAADESDMLGTRSGMNYPGSQITDYRTCVDMIEDVVAHWDPDRLVEVDE